MHFVTETLLMKLQLTQQTIWTESCTAFIEFPFSEPEWISRDFRISMTLPEHMALHKRPVEKVAYKNLTLISSYKIPSIFLYELITHTLSPTVLYCNIVL
jgi:hypothetical protein